MIKRKKTPLITGHLQTRMENIQFWFTNRRMRQQNMQLAKVRYSIRQKSKNS
ncbi:MAG TPA: hypothetical protein DEA97_07165 [Bacteroidales bacterium]|nr:hypothetical protein [Bacteroidales bacterium]